MAALSKMLCLTLFEKYKFRLKHAGHSKPSLMLVAKMEAL